MKRTLEPSPTNLQIKYKRVKCKICFGTGRDRSNSVIGVLCQKCNGTGWRMFPEGKVEKCPTCSGRGKDYRLAINGQVCEECDGFGEFKLL
ncbi:MAG: hypothetical protein ABSF44_07065 [Candidatus Bathyarchaeia archaeon]|jgi:DnaJ-class molecular chaperone